MTTSSGNKRKPFLIGSVAAALLVALAPQYIDQLDGFFPATETTQSGTGNTDQAFADAFNSRTGDLQLQGDGIVSKILSDDRHGSRHQRFIVTLASGQTLLIAHNIDLAPRVKGLQHGDTVSFYGEYEWNDAGGLMHWTHHDPRGSHVDGWIKHQGRTYQ